MNEKPFISLPTAKGFELISPLDIISVCSDDKYIHITIENKPKRIINMTMGRAEILFSHLCLVRCHQRYIVNVHKIMEVIDQCSVIVLKNDEQIPISRTYKKNFKETLGKFCT